jgi:putative ABC transport system permease protein
MQFTKIAMEQGSNSDILLTSLSDEKINKADLNTSKIQGLKDYIKYYQEDALINENNKFFSINLMALDFHKEKKHSSYKLLEGVEPTKGQCLLSNVIKEKYNLSIGNMVRIITNKERYNLKVSGIVDSNGIAAANYGRCILLNINNVNDYGNVSYKLILKDNVNKKTEKNSLAKKFKSTYKVEYPEGKSEDYISSVSSLFTVIELFGFLVVLLGCYSIYSTISNIALYMRKDLAILKVLGAKKKGIILLLLFKGLAIGIIGSAFGIIGGLAASKIMVRLIEGILDNGNFKVNELIIQYNKVLEFAFLGIILSIVSTIPTALKISKETIIEGLCISMSKKNINRKLAFGAFTILLLTIIIFSISKHTKSAELVVPLLLLVGIYVSCIIIIKPFVSLAAIVLSKLSVLNCFLVKNNADNNKRSSLNLIYMFSIILAFSIGIFGTVMAFTSAINNLSKHIYHGDICISNDIGVNKSLIDKVKSVKGVGKVYSIYQKNIDINDISIKIKGLALDKNNLDFLSDYKNEANKLKGKDTILVSKKLLKALHLEVGKLIDISSAQGIKHFLLAGSFKTMEHDGNVFVTSEYNFKNTFKDYGIFAIMIYKDSKYKAIDIKSRLENIINDKSVFVTSISEKRNDYIKSNKGLIMLFGGLIVILFITSMLMIINFITINIYDNEYDIAVLKALGARKNQVMSQFISIGIVYSVLGGIIGVIFGIIINYLFVKLINSGTIYTLKFAINVHCTILLFLLSVLLTVAASVFSVAGNYKNIKKVCMD